MMVTPTSLTAFLTLSLESCISIIYVYNLSRLCTTNVNRSNKRKWFQIRKEKMQTISCKNRDANYADDLALLANKSVQTDALLHNLEQAAIDIGLNMNADNQSFKQEGTSSS